MKIKKYLLDLEWAQPFTVKPCKSFSAFLRGGTRWPTGPFQLDSMNSNQLFTCKCNWRARRRASDQPRNNHPVHQNRACKRLPPQALPWWKEAAGQHHRDQIRPTFLSVFGYEKGKCAQEARGRNESLVQLQTGQWGCASFVDLCGESSLPQTHPPLQVPTDFSSRSWGSYPMILLPLPCHRQLHLSNWHDYHGQLGHLES